MNWRRLNLLIFLAATFVLQAAWSYEITVTPVNRLSQKTGWLANPTPVTATPQFQGVGITTSAVGPASALSPTHFPSGGSYVLKSSNLGFPVASGVPLYGLGDLIKPPLTNSNGVEVPASYWRSEPLKPGEVKLPAFRYLSSGNLLPTQPLVANLANGTYTTYYYSAHADAVFASQSGQVSVTWVSSVPVADPNNGGAMAYEFKTETFSVSSTAKVPTRKIFWTENQFSGPMVSVNTGSVQSVNIVYNNAFPEKVTNPYSLSGTTAAEGVYQEARTLWFEIIAGRGALRAHNTEGRIFVEYLGNFVSGSTVRRQFLGADIVEVVRTPTPTFMTTHLGDELLPPDADTNLSASFPIGNDASAYVAITADSSGRQTMYAERLNNIPDNVSLYWSETHDAGLAKPAGATPLSINWPKYFTKYTLSWPDESPDKNFYVQSTSDVGGFDIGRGFLFGGSSLPQLITQDDAYGNQFRIDQGTQSLVLDLSNDNDQQAFALLKFSSEGKFWYVRLRVQDPSRPDYQEPDSLASIQQTAYVGDRLNAPAGCEIGGWIISGNSYNPSAYIDPSVSGVESAAAGAIIPVNAPPGQNQLQVVWFKKITPPNAFFSPFYVPFKRSDYTLVYPPNASKIVIASNAGSGDLSSAMQAGSIYYQNDASKLGFNPNEEHAVLLAGRAYALRDDLNIVSSGNYSSAPCVLLQYTDPTDKRPAMKAFLVSRESDQYKLEYPVTAGSVIQPPMPLALWPLHPSNTEVAVNSDTPTNTASPTHYQSFTIRDRTGRDWVYRGPHTSNGTASITMRFYYKALDGFYIPGATTQPVTGDTLPFLRPLSNGQPVGSATDPAATSADVVYRPTWPTQIPKIALAETLTLSVRGLPEVFNQPSATILYQQSIASSGNRSVLLFDPTNKKSYALSSSGLNSIPSSAASVSYQGKTYFQNISPHLQTRFYYDSAFPSASGLGALVLEGQLVQPGTGENYLNPSTLSAADLLELKNLVASDDSAKTKWDAAINALSTSLVAYKEDPSRRGTYIQNASTSFESTSLPIIPDFTKALDSSNFVVDSYALTATGEATGYVVLLVGNGNPKSTNASDPVSIKIFEVVPNLHVGDAKALLAKNPLSELASLRHSSDFAALTENYEFDWRYTPSSSNTATYTYSFNSRLSSNSFKVIEHPSGLLASTQELANANSAILPFNLNINSIAPSSTPGIILVPNAANLDFSQGVPDLVVLSAELSSNYDGFVVFVNGVQAASFRAPAQFGTSASGSRILSGDLGLPIQVRLPSVFFNKSVANTIQIGLFSTADLNSTSSVNFALHSSTTQDAVLAQGSPWIKPDGTFSNILTIGEGRTLSTPLLLLTDNYFTMRYRPKRYLPDGSVNPAWIIVNGSNVEEGIYSQWTAPVLLEGWTKRVLGAITPFNQRMTDLSNNALNTDVDLLTQAGKRWEGDIALSLENINEPGLIEIYETVLNRTKLLTIDSGQSLDYAPANNAILLASGYLADLYTILGDEALADASNPTIAVSSTSNATAVNTSRFAFEGQVGSLLEEELALLRGRDDFLSPGTGIQPVYNRLYWNYTRGIRSGEAIYALNYDVREKAGGSAEDGQLNAADAALKFPQGHGDAYGHYLTALKNYYKLLNNPSFSWTPSAETVTVLGQPVTVDFKDERKFASAASSVAKSAFLTASVTWRSVFRDGSENGWSHLRDGAFNSRTGVIRSQGFDEWVSRGGQGAYLHWVAANSLLPEKDNDPSHSGVQLVDRQTVPELGLLATASESFQNLADNANAHLNPLGLAPDAVAFDISPDQLQAGNSHYEQIHQRALTATLNAKGAFDQAARMSADLRNQAQTTDDLNIKIVDQERAYRYQLEDIYGTPYPTDIGPGKTYQQGYSGPDLVNYFVIDPDAVVSSTAASAISPLTMTFSYRTGNAFDNSPTEDVVSALFDGAAGSNITTQTVTYRFDNLSIAQSAPTFFNSASPGKRAKTGRLQESIQRAQFAYQRLENLSQEIEMARDDLKRASELVVEFAETTDLKISKQSELLQNIAKKARNAVDLNLAASFNNEAAERLKLVGQLTADAVPDNLVAGLATTIFVGAPIGAAGKAAFFVPAAVFRFMSLGFEHQSAIAKLEAENATLGIDLELEMLDAKPEKKQLVYNWEKEYAAYRKIQFEIAERSKALREALDIYRNTLQEGQRVLAEREIFRKRAAALISGYRTRDLTFRTFRNEALEQYATLFDLAARYTYLAAKSYDYETGLLGSDSGREILDGIVASRSLGDLTGGVPQATVSTLGDAGLAGTMARLQADWAVAESRLGINNPDTNGTLFSLRRELFRVTTSANSTEDDANWQQALEQHRVADITADPDLANACAGLRRSNGAPVPGFVIPFNTVIEPGKNFFGLPLVEGDHAFSESNFSTKIFSSGIVLRGYQGMTLNYQTTGNTTSTNGNSTLSATPYVYLIPCGQDKMQSPPLGNSGVVRSWQVRDQALPLPYNLGATAFNSGSFFNTFGTLTEKPWILRTHPAFRAVDNPAYFYGLVPREFTNTRLIGRSAWNTRWKLVIPAHALHSNTQTAMDRFVGSVQDIELFLRTYSHSGN
jgi:hypothetical protein